MLFRHTISQHQSLHLCLLCLLVLPPLPPPHDRLTVHLDCSLCPVFSVAGNIDSPACYMTMHLKPLTPIGIFNSFIWWWWGFISGCAQDLIHALCFQITTGGLWGPYWMPGMKSWIDCIQRKCIFSHFPLHFSPAFLLSFSNGHCPIYFCFFHPRRCFSSGCPGPSSPCLICPQWALSLQAGTVFWISWSTGILDLGYPGCLPPCVVFLYVFSSSLLKISCPYMRGFISRMSLLFYWSVICVSVFYSVQKQTLRCFLIQRSEWLSDGSHRNPFQQEAMRTLFICFSDS